MTTKFEKFKKFRKIPHFDNLMQEVKDKAQFIGRGKNSEPVYDRTKPLPTVEFHSTIKVHGTNACVSLDSDHNIRYQSRNQLITENNDNQGFVKWLKSDPMRHMRLVANLTLAKQAFSNIAPVQQVLIYGEFAGENIQKGVAVSSIKKAFFPFLLKVEFTNGAIAETDQVSQFLDTLGRVFPLTLFERKRFIIDFNKPLEALAEIENYVLEVEKHCPVGAVFDVDGIGEGIVLTDEVCQYVFKAKGEKHQVKKSKRNLTDEELAELKTIEGYVTTVVTENRVKQGIEYLAEMGLPKSRASTGDFIKWIVNDIHSEENYEITKLGLNEHKLNKEIGKQAVKLFFKLLTA
ncbi:MAG: hypothetical protein KGV51_04790 [Moraxellaceae bacterium]|nr:hypothetical protein [Moraxellaceae bacterium]